MRLLLLGADGQLGYELRGTLGCVGEVYACGRAEADLTRVDSLRRALDASSPDVIVNAAAYTDVDGAERDPKAARLINTEAVAFLGEEALRRRIGLVHFSTDFVFDGHGATAYRESDEASPLNAYGQSKLDGERALDELTAPAIVLRTAWVYSLRRKSFVTAILRLARERDELRIVADQVGNPTFCRDLAQGTASLVHGLRRDLFEAFSKERGVYHLAGEGEVSRYDFARTIIELDPKRSEHRVQAITPIPSSEYPLPAERPLHSSLSCDKAEATFGVRLPSWKDALVRAFGG